MNRYLDNVVAELGEDIQYLIALSIYGTLHIVSVSDNAMSIRPTDHWQNNPKVTGKTLCAEYLPDWLVQFPQLLQQTQEYLSAMSGPKQRMRALDSKSVFLEPG